ncbi:MAG: family 43 glycosylhydrolase, partial [Bacteroidetes bacterium]|nr:family 43 glycosylhydrolase [Bacteroidota bacterium]
EDLVHFKKVADDKVAMNFHPRHGTIMPITSKEASLLESAWLNERSIITWPQSGQIKKNNISFDTATQTASFILKPDASVKAMNPGFIELPGVSIQPSGNVDFSKGKVNYTIRIGQKAAKTFAVSAAVQNNPVLDGYYADPEVMYSRKTGQFYIYPTSDGYAGWSGNYFKVFSSPDLVHWQDSGKILQLGKDVSWTNRNAWAPCIAEKAVNGDYRYYYYFCAAQKIGVAVAENPTGPFKDLGRPMIDHTPPGVKSGQQIDPAVFTDPQTNKSYLFWGNGYMAGAELNEDMVSLKDSTISVLTPDRTFREGVYVFFRKGVYYYMWSENDTRDQNYDVRYGMSGS